MTTRRKLFFTLILLGLTCFIALVGAEIVTRLTSPYGYITPDTLRAATPDYQPAVFARHVIRQQAKTVVVNGVVQFRINSHGYRGGEFADIKPEGVTRIMFYGGSSVFDQESRTDDDWPHRVERGLQRRGFTDVEVINAGIPGYASAEAVGTFFSEGHLFRPDYVLLSDEWNDIKLFRSSQSLLREFTRDEIPDDPRTTYQNGLDRLLSNVSQLYVRLRSRYYTWKLKIGAEGMRPAGDYSSTFNEAALMQYKLNLETFVDIARNIGAVPILMIEGRLVTPDNSEADKRRINYDYVLLTHEALCRAFARQDEIIHEVAKAKGVQVIDPSSLLNGKSDLFANHIHLNDKGSEVQGEFVAVELAHVLQARGQHAEESDDGITPDWSEMTDKMWNLTSDQWSSVLRSDANATEVGSSLRKSGVFVPWSQVLVDETADCVSTADLGCGRGEHSAVLARAGRQTTLIDWSHDNLAFCQRLYSSLALQGRFCQADITRPLPLETNSIDAVFSCGVFEYFNASQIDAIMAEAFRVARKRVIIMVPNAWAVAYRVGKWYMERAGTWEWGGEVPSYTVKPHFQRAGGISIREFAVGGRHSVDFLAPLPGGSRLIRLFTRALRLTRHQRPSKLRQGYLLITIGEKPAASSRQ